MRYFDVHAHTDTEDLEYAQGVAAFGFGERMDTKDPGLVQRDAAFDFDAHKDT